MTRLISWGARLLGVLVVLLSCSQVHAGGLYLFDRGARPLSRGGAFVAGADDPNALWYNPAGLGESENQVQMDAVLTINFIDYTRMYPDGSYAPTVKAKPTPIPIPALAFSNDFGSRDWVFGGGVFAPNAMLINWPRSLASTDGTTRLPSPTRYSLIGLKGSILANLAGGVAYRGIKHFYIGADVQAMLGRFRAQTALSACDGTACVNPEDPDYDAYATIDQFAYGVTGSVGIKYELWGIFRFGASATLPYTLRGAGPLDLRMPTAAIFDGAQLQGDKTKLEMKFPTIIRGGIETRPLPYLRMEGAFVWEQWSRQQTIDIIPQNVSLNNVTGIGNYEVGTIGLQRRMNDVWSLRGGYEIFIPPRWMIAKFKNLNLAMRGGMAYEKSAFSKNNALTPLTIDPTKLIISAGLSFNLAKWLRMDTSAGWIHMWNENITNSPITQPTAIRPANADASVIANGKYEMEAFFLGGGFVIKTD